MTTRDPRDENQIRRSRRFKWTVLIGFALLAVATLLGVLFIPWDIRPQTTPDLDLPPATVAPAANAFTYLKAATQLQVTEFTTPDGQERRVGSLLGAMDDPAKPWDPAFADEVLAANAAVFPELEKALACQQYASPPAKDLSTDQSWLSDHAALSWWLRLKSKRAQVSGDAAGAARTGLQALRQGQLMANGPSQLEWGLGNSCQQSALMRLEEIVADARTPVPVLQETLEALNRWDPQEASNGAKNVWRGKFAMIRETLKNPRLGARYCLSDDMPPWFCKLPYANKPNMTIPLIAKHYRHLIACADKPYTLIAWNYHDRPDYPSTWLGKIVFYAKPNAAGNIMFFATTQCDDPIFSKKSQTQALVATLRLKIALRLYEQKHGELPEALSALVPEFIDGIPEDPYTGQPFGYAKTKNKVWTGSEDLGHLENQDRKETIRPDLSDGYLVMPLGTRELKPIPASKPSASKPPQGASTP